MSTLRLSDLREYQRRAYEFVITRGKTVGAHIAGLFLDMGLGKTIVTLLAVRYFVNEKVAKRFLLIGPIRVIESVWIQEAAKWEPTQRIKFQMIRGNAATRDAALRRHAHIYLINPEMVEWLIEWMKVHGCPFDGLIVDESSQFKSIKAKRWKALRLALGMFNVRIILTGTPTPNNLLEIWPQAYLLDQGARLGTSFYRFCDRFFEGSYSGYDFEPRQGTMETVVNALGDIVLRLDARDYLDIRKPITNRVIVKLPDDVKRMYKKFEREMFLELDETDVEAFNSAALSMRCHQIANGAIYNLNDDGERLETFTELHDTKMTAIKEIVEETGSPIIIAYQFRHDLARLKRLFPDAPVFGGAQKGSTESIRLAFAAGKIPVLLAHPKSASHGMNDMETHCHTVAFFSLTWSREQHDQLIARIGGARAATQGNPHPVIAHYVIAEGTVDEVMADVLRQKGIGQRATLDAFRAYRNGYQDILG